MNFLLITNDGAGLPIALDLTQEGHNVVGFIVKPFSLYRSHTYTEEEYEKDMAKLWKLYGREQPQIVSG